ncbi:Phage lysozyme [compost metagenome]
MSIKIPISADFNGDDIKKQISQINAAMKQMGEAVAKANGQKFEPITLSGKEDLKYFVAQSEKLLKIQGELRNRMVKSGQGGKNPVMANWNQMYLNESARMKRQQEMLVFLGASFEDINNPTKPGRPSSPPPINRRPPGAPPSPPVNPWVRQGTKVIQSGLNAAGPVGNVASNALGTGMSSGFGAGLMGLMGGIVALGVGKLVSGVMEKIDQAEQNNVSYDRLKRTLGDVNVSFEGLKTLIHDSGNNLAITFDEAGKLSMQFAKLANLSDDQYKQLAPELATGVGFARGFGLDPSQSMGMLGTMRGLRITGNDQDSRRMALLIGETIGKSGAFAKAEEVMDALSNYATTQTRNSLSRANISGYAGQYSALASSGIPGLDPAGAGSMLSRINSSLMSGGAHGEASQFFSSMVANRMGLDPIQMAILREGGAFATNDQMFGEGSAASRYGVSGPGGNSTFLQETLGTMRQKYRDPGMLAMATANHLGIGMNQAMALLSVKPNEMGTLQRGLSSAGIDMSSLNSAGIANLAKVYTGSASDRQSVANSLYGRTGSQALTSSEADRLRTVMASGDADAQKKMLAELVATRDQERTTGSDIRDSKNLLDNIKTSIADKLIPLVTEMRHGVMAIAGVGKDGMTPQKIQEKVIRAEFDDKADQIRQRYQSQIDEQMERHEQAKFRSAGIPTPEEAQLSPQEQLRAVTARQEAAKQEMDAANAEIKRIEAARDKELSANRASADAKVDQAYGRGGSNPPAGWRPGVTPINRVSDVEVPYQQQNLSAFLETIAASEGANYDTVVGGSKFSDYSQHPNKVGVITGDGPSTAAGRYQITNTTWKRIKRKLGLTDFSPESQDRAAIELLRERGALQDVLNGDVDAAIAKLGDEWQSLPSGKSRHQGKRSRAFFDDQYGKALERNKPSPALLPNNDAGAGGQTNVSVAVPPIEVIHRNERGQQVAPSQTLQPIVTSSRPFGARG